MATQGRYGRILRSENDKVIKSYKELSSKELSIVMNSLSRLYDINKKDLEDYAFVKKGDDVWLTSKRASKILNVFPNLKIETIGFRALRNAFADNIKPTTNFVQLMQKHIKKNIRILDKNDLDNYIRGYDIPNKTGLHGFCILKYDDDVIGVGLAIDDNIKNQIPKSRVIKTMI